MANETWFGATAPTKPPVPNVELSLNPWIDDFGWSSAGSGEWRWGVDTLACM
ncbi:hypothetical protein LAUMK142_00442 [Mycobacterium pseudokansasii]|uniref:Uncharacterized protein n=1 Tax=Mycobacterium pseudokansasii TaxID=2341080 RepID=A0A498QJ81_9MYCO|nr:hypothetical protein LAUMK142_00442 [Mycobacterium pseudokansasii]